MSTREPEPGIVTDLADRLTRGGDRCVDRLLSAQQRRTGAGGRTPRHGMLFLVRHPVSDVHNAVGPRRP
jgi:hypothetical protein